MFIFCSFRLEEKQVLLDIFVSLLTETLRTVYPDITTQDLSILVTTGVGMSFFLKPVRREQGKEFHSTRVCFLYFESMQAKIFLKFFVDITNFRYKSSRMRFIEKCRPNFFMRSFFRSLVHIMVFFI